MSIPPRLAQDVDELKSDGFAVGVVEESPRYFVVFEGLALPEPYQPATTGLMIMADYLYPQSALDMFWTEPHVRLPGGLPQGADQFAEFIGRTWQRWSWHYPWNPHAHGLRSHLQVFFDRLERAA